MMPAGNVRIEEGGPQDGWYRSCCDLLMSRLGATGRGIKVRFVLVHVGLLSCRAPPTNPRARTPRTLAAPTGSHTVDCMWIFTRPLACRHVSAPCTLRSNSKRWPTRTPRRPRHAGGRAGAPRVAPAQPPPAHDVRARVGAGAQRQAAPALRQEGGGLPGVPVCGGAPPDARSAPPDACCQHPAPDAQVPAPPDVHPPKWPSIMPWLQVALHHALAAGYLQAATWNGFPPAQHYAALGLDGAVRLHSSVSLADQLRLAAASNAATGAGGCHPGRVLTAEYIQGGGGDYRCKQVQAN